MTTFKVIILPIANYLFAVPMNTVLQVRRCPPELRHSPVDAELIHLENRPVLVLNLQARLASSPPSPQLTGTTSKNKVTTSDPFLVLTQSRAGELCGLRVDRLPDMLDIPANTVQTLPEAYRQNNLQGLAKYVAILPREDKRLVVYLLDLDQVLQANYLYSALA